MNASVASVTRGNKVSEVAAYFLRLGCIAFGGPAAHIAIMRRELVTQRKWLTDEEFVDMLGVTNLIPGPNSTEMTMHSGYHRAGWGGLLLGGLAFILPAVAIVLALAWAYVRYGDTPAGEGILAGVGPVVLAIIIQAIWGLRTAALKTPLSMVLAALVFAVVFLFDANEIVALFAAGAVTLAWYLARHTPGAINALLPLGLPAPLAFQAAAESAPTVGGLFWVFLKVGALLYGSGYVLVSFLESELVDSRGWLTDQQLVDAIAVGQFTPGPLFSSATFVGYIIEGWDGAAAATAGIFLPSFVLVMLTAPFVSRLRRLGWTGAFLDGINAAALALMATTTIILAQETLDTAFGAALFAVGAIVLVRYNPNSAWLVLAGAALGVGWEVAS
ncbi:MAG: chromate efflux transporter [Dehalococcoidia bacterium]